MKRMLCFVMAIAMIFSITVSAYAESSSSNTAFEGKGEPQSVSLFDYAEKVTKTEGKQIKGSSQTYTEVSGEITNPSVIEMLYEQGLIELNEDGTLPRKAVVTQIVLESSGEPQGTKGGISITKSNYYDGQYFDEYDRYVISGPSEFTQTYSRTSTANWNTNMTGSVTVGGNIYGIVDEKLLFPHLWVTPLAIRIREHPPIR